MISSKKFLVRKSILIELKWKKLVEKNLYGNVLSFHTSI